MNKNIVSLLKAVAVLSVLIGVWVIVASAAHYNGLQIADVVLGGSLVIGAIVPAAFAQVIELLQRIASGVAPLPTDKPKT